jgi:hypothetical protein
MYLKQRIAAIGSDGERQILNVWGHRINTSTLQGRSSRAEGLPEIRTANGLAVNRLTRGRYQVVQTGEILESSDPDAL